MKDLEIKKQMVLNGDINPLLFLTELSELEKAIKEAKEEILQDAILEFERHGSASVKEYGYEISASSSGRYDYSKNMTWHKHKQAMKEIEAKMQAAFKNQSTLLDENTGEVYEPAIYKANKQSLKLKKLK